MIIKLYVNKWLMFNWIVSDTLQYLKLINYVQKKVRLIRKYYQQNLFTKHIYLIYMYKGDLALNNLQLLISNKRPNHTRISMIHHHHHHRHHHHLPLIARNSLTLFNRPYHRSLPVGLSDYIHCLCRARLREGVH